MTIPIFLPNLDRYGRIGHQTSKIMTSFALAHIFNGKYIATDFKFFPYRANELIDFHLSAKAFKFGNIVGHHILSAGFSSPHGNDHYDTSNRSGLRQMYSDILDVLNTYTFDSFNFVIISLPFDQPCGKLINIFNHHHVYRDFRNTFIDKRLKEPPSQEIIGIHIRRGDINETSSSSWWIPDEYYIDLITNILLSKKSSFVLRIFTQAPISNYLRSYLVELSQKYSNKVELHITEESWSNDLEIADLIALAQSKVVIGGMSSYACFAAFLGKCQYIYLWHNEMKDLSFPVSKASNFDIMKCSPTDVAECVCNLY